MSVLSVIVLLCVSVANISSVAANETTLAAMVVPKNPNRPKQKRDYMYLLSPRVFNREVFKAKHRQTGKKVALKKVLMENEKEGVRSRSVSSHVLLNS